MQHSMQYRFVSDLLQRLASIAPQSVRLCYTVLLLHSVTPSLTLSLSLPSHSQDTIHTKTPRTLILRHTNSLYTNKTLRWGGLEMPEI
jgi:hypothetical protein